MRTIERLRPYADIANVADVRELADRTSYGFLVRNQSIGHITADRLRAILDNRQYILMVSDQRDDGADYLFFRSDAMIDMSGRVTTLPHYAWRMMVDAFIASDATLTVVRVPFGASADQLPIGEG